MTLGPLLLTDRGDEYVGMGVRNMACEFGQFQRLLKLFELFSLLKKLP